MFDCRLALVIVAVAGAFAACSKQASTEIVVLVDSDYAVPSELAKVRASISFASGDAQIHEFEFSSTGVQLPFSFAVGPKDPSYKDNVTIEVLGLSSSGKKLASRRATTHFISGKKLLLKIFIAKSCEGVMCRMGETCSEAGCVTETVDPSTLPEVQPGNELDGGRGRHDDGGVDAGAFDGAAMDSEAMDLGAPDAEFEDAEATDAEGTDAQVSSDAGLPDAAAQDAQIADALGQDASPSDIGGQDAAPVDTGAQDAGPTDTGLADGGASDASPVDARAECSAAAIVDLNASGIHMGQTYHYVTNNIATPDPAGLAAPSCGGGVAHDVVFRFVPGSTHMRISTDYASTAIDTVAWVLNRCSPMAFEIGCDDDGHLPPNSLASILVVSSTVTPVYVVIGGYLGATGTFDLGVTNLTAVPLNGPCDPTLNYCPSASDCLLTSTSSTCVADGARNGHCRTTNPACDPGSGCNGPTGSTTSRCVPIVPLGGSCDPRMVTNLCAPPTVCTPAMGGGSTCQMPVAYLESAINPVFVDACATGTHEMLTSLDDGHTTTALMIPFAFQLYLMPYNQIWADTNGFATLGPTQPRDIFTPVVPDAGDGPMIWAYWQDLVVRSATTGAAICSEVIGVPPNRRFVIEWKHVQAYQRPLVDLTFELVLNENGNTIDLIYQTLLPTTGVDAPLANGTNAAIGLQNAMGMSFTRHAGGVTTTTGIRFTPP